MNARWIADLVTKGKPVNRPEDTLLDLSEECPTDQAEAIAAQFPWLASSLAELMIARNVMPPDSWFTVYVQDQVLPFCEE